MKLAPLMIGLASLVAVPTAQAIGNEMGNGGDAIVCATAHAELGGKKAMLLDYYEATSRWSLKPDLGANSLSVEDKVRLVFGRLATLDPDRKNLYFGRLANFWSEAQLEPQLSIPTIPDQGTVQLPASDCNIVQLAYQSQPELPGDKRYVIRKEVWDQLDDDSHAGLLIHEIIYREAIAQGQQNSRRSRYFNVQLSSNAVFAMTESQYAEMLMTQLLLPATRQIQGGEFQLATLKIAPDGTPLEGDLEPNGKLQLKYKTQQFIASVHAVFRPDGKVSSISGSPDLPAMTEFNISATGSAELAGVTTINFGSDMGVESILCAAAGCTAKFPLCDQEFAFCHPRLTGNSFEVYATGVVKAGVVEDDFQPIMTACGGVDKPDEQNMYAQRGTVIAFHENGAVQHGTVDREFVRLCDDQKVLHDYVRGTELDFNGRAEVIHSSLPPIAAVH